MIKKSLKSKTSNSHTWAPFNGHQAIGSGQEREGQRQKKTALGSQQVIVIRQQQ
jgi:hypothetical protein